MSSWNAPNRSPSHRTTALIRPAPIRRPLADWIESRVELYPGRSHAAVVAMPALPFLLMAAIPFARATFTG